MITVGEMGLFLIGFVIWCIICGEIFYHIKKNLFKKSNQHLNERYFIKRFECYWDMVGYQLILIFLMGFFYNMIVNFNVPLN